MNGSYHCVKKLAIQFSTSETDEKLCFFQHANLFEDNWNIMNNLSFQNVQRCLIQGYMWLEKRKDFVHLSNTERDSWSRECSPLISYTNSISPKNVRFEDCERRVENKKSKVEKSSFFRWERQTVEPRNGASSSRKVSWSTLHTPWVVQKFLRIPDVKKIYRSLYILYTV